MTDEFGAQGPSPEALRTEQLSKSFPGTRALSNVNLSVRRGEIVALLGGNGSGKSTLIKLLAGVHRADPGGTIVVGSSITDAEQWSPAHARSANLRFVHQSLGLFADLTVAENIAIGRGFERRALRIDWAATRRHSQSVLERFHAQAAPGTVVSDLRPADQTMVAIARALQDQEGAHEAILLLDEPTAALPASEVAVLHDALRRYRAAGQTIIYVSHRLDEVHAIADRVAVLRDGELIASVAANETTERELVMLVTGRRSTEGAKPEQSTSDRAVSVSQPDRVVISGLCAGPLNDVDLRLARGEIVGVAGLLGSGRTTLLRALFGDVRSRGDVRIDDQVHDFDRPAQAMAAGLAYLPEDRARDGAFDGLSVQANLSAAVVPTYWRRCRLHRRSERDDARRLIGQYSIRAASEADPIGSLSGGNQQKVMLARWMRREPRVLLLDEPTQGVDVGARADIHALLEDLSARGTAILVVSSDFAELTSLCHRVIVLRNGRVAASLLRSELSVGLLNELAYLDELEDVS